LQRLEKETYAAFVTLMTEPNLTARQVVEQHEQDLGILLPKTVDARAFLAVYEEEIDYLYEKIVNSKMFFSSDGQGQ
jgi:hypothetical protein